MVQTTELYQTLVNLYEFSTGNKPDEQVLDRLVETLEHNDFNADENTPDWLLNFFRAIIQSVSVDLTSYTNNQPIQGDVVNLLAELEDIIPGEWEDEGESLMVSFRSGAVIGFVMFEGDAYAVRVNHDR